MPRRFLRRILPRREHLHDRWYMQPFRALLHDPALWSVNRKGVVRAFAIGLFIALQPIPGQILLASAIAVWLRINLPVAVLTLFVSNPLTMVQMYYLCYLVGAALLGMDPLPLQPQASWSWLAERIAHVGPPLFLGSLVVGLVAAAVGAFALNGAWRVALAVRYSRRRRAQRDRASKSRRHRD